VVALSERQPGPVPHQAGMALGQLLLFECDAMSTFRTAGQSIRTPPR
jgi:hypothetical protein